MTFLATAKRRCSIRAYQPTPVEQEKVDAIIEAAHVAPTAANRQPVRIVQVESAAGLARLGKAANLHGAPLAFIVCADHDRAWRRRFDGMTSTAIDASILTDHMMMEATDLAWAACGSARSTPPSCGPSSSWRRRSSPSTSWRWDTPPANPRAPSVTPPSAFR